MPAGGVAMAPGALFVAARGFAVVPGAIVVAANGIALVPGAIVVVAGGVVIVAGGGCPMPAARTSSKSGLTASSRLVALQWCLVPS